MLVWGSVGFRALRGVKTDNILRLGLYRDNGQENGNYYNRLYRDYKDFKL